MWQDNAGRRGPAGDTLPLPDVLVTVRLARWLLDMSEQMKFRDGTRVLAPTLAASAVLLLLGSVSAWYLHSLQRSSSELLSESIAKIQAAENLVIVSQSMQALVDEYLLVRDGSLVTKVYQLEESANRWLNRALELADSEEELAAIEQVRRGYRDCFERVEVLGRTLPQQDPEVIVNEVRDFRLRHIVAPADEYRRINREQANQASISNRELADRMGLALLSLGMCGSVAGLLAGYVIATKVNRQLEVNRQAAMKARQLAAMGQLAAGVAHELRNPLTSLKLIVQTALADEQSATIERRDFDVLEEEIERMNDTIQSFLDYARPPRIEKRPCSISHVLQQTVSLLSHRAAQTGIRFELELPDNVTDVDGDQAQLKQLFLNLLINAMDASTDGGTVTLTVKHDPTGENDRIDRPTRQAGGQCVIEVADQGAGLPAEHSERIFEPFVSTKEAGTGLGLSICSRIVKEHGGSIRADNRPEGGALFVITLPISCAADQANDRDRQTAVTADTHPKQT